MEEPDHHRISLRRTIVRDSLLMFVGLLLIILCFVLLGVAQSYDHSENWNDCDHCGDRKHAKAFRLVGAVCFLFGFTVMTIFWWHIRALRSAYQQRLRFMELQRLLENRERLVGTSRNRTSLGKRNIA